MAHDMVDFAYYADAYLGSLIPEKEFPRLAKRAGEYLNKLSRIYRVEGGADARAMAVCAMAEELYRSGNRRGVASASIGGVSVRYDDGGSRRLLGQMYRQAAIYLDMYRGR